MDGNADRQTDRQTKTSHIIFFCIFAPYSSIHPLLFPFLDVVIEDATFTEGDTVGVEVCVNLNFINPVEDLLGNINFNLQLRFDDFTAGKYRLMNFKYFSL